MKLLAAVVLLAVFGASTTNATTLVKGFEQLRETAKIDELIQIAAEYSENYAGVTDVFNYLRGSAVESAWTEVLQTPEVVELLQWLESKGVQTELLHSRFNNFALPKFNIGSRKSRSVGVNVEWDQMMTEILRVYPQEKVFTYLQAEGGEIAELSVKMNKLRPVFKEIANKSSVTIVVKDLRNLGVDTDQIMGMVRGIFGFALIL